MDTLRWLTPNWPAPPQIQAASTLRSGGVSAAPYDSLNLGTHVGDDPHAVATNRARLCEALNLPTKPVWLEQVHGTDVVNIDAPLASNTADAAVSFVAGRVCAVMTADCLPVLLCSRHGDRVAAAHAGWRGLAGGVLARTIEALHLPASDVMAWLGPAIEPEAFEVGAEVRDAFVSRHANDAQAFTENARGRFQADLYQLARFELVRLGVQAVYGGGWRCYQDEQRFFSHRRGAPTGRMASLIWIQAIAS